MQPQPMSMIKLIFILLFFHLAGEALRVIPQHTPSPPPLPEYPSEPTASSSPS
jgi:hypothetical protein